MKLFRALNRRLSTARFDANLGRIVAFAWAAVMLPLGLLKLMSLRLTEVELYFGILLVMTVALLAVVIGLLLGIQASKPNSAP
jgi:hypothetical protein